MFSEAFTKKKSGIYAGIKLQSQINCFMDFWRHLVALDFNWEVSEKKGVHFVTWLRNNINVYVCFGAFKYSFVVAAF